MSTYASYWEICDWLNFRFNLKAVENMYGQKFISYYLCDVLGGGLGLAMGLFLGSMDTHVMQDEMTGKQQLIYQAKQMGRRSWSSAKAFAVMGLIFSAAECVVEKVKL